MTGDWDLLCAEAEEVLDADVQRYERDWLPRVLPSLDRWPPPLRRCPDRWFRTPRARADLLLRLGGVSAADLSPKPPHRSPGQRSVSSVSAPDAWTVFATDDLEFIVASVNLDGHGPDGAGVDGAAGDGAAGPDPIGLQVAGFVRSNWAGLRESAEATVNRAAAGWDDYYALGAVPAGHSRFESIDLVTVDPTPPGFTVHCEDHRHTVNGWPYGFWMVDFAWALPVGVRVGTYDYNQYYGLHP